MPTRLTQNGGRPWLQRAPHCQPEAATLHVRKQLNKNRAVGRASLPFLSSSRLVTPRLQNNPDFPSSPPQLAFSLSLLRQLPSITLQHRSRKLPRDRNNLRTVRQRIVSPLFRRLRVALEQSPISRPSAPKEGNSRPPNFAQRLAALATTAVPAIFSAPEPA